MGGEPAVKQTQALVVVRDVQLSCLAFGSLLTPGPVTR